MKKTHNVHSTYTKEEAEEEVLNLSSVDCSGDNVNTNNSTEASFINIINTNNPTESTNPITTTNSFPIPSSETGVASAVFESLGTVTLSTIVFSVAANSEKTLQAVCNVARGVAGYVSKFKNNLSEGLDRQL